MAKWLWVKTKQEGLVTRVLVHVSTYQGSFLAPFFFFGGGVEPHPNGSGSKIGTQNETRQVETWIKRPAVQWWLSFDPYPN